MNSSGVESFEISVRPIEQLHDLSRTVLTSLLAYWIPRQWTVAGKSKGGRPFLYTTDQLRIHPMHKLLRQPTYGSEQNRLKGNILMKTWNKTVYWKVPTTQRVSKAIIVK